MGGNLLQSWVNLTIVCTYLFKDITMLHCIAMKQRKLWKTGEGGLCCSSSAIQTWLGPSSLLEERSKTPSVFVVGYSPNWGKQPRYIDNHTLLHTCRTTARIEKFTKAQERGLWEHQPRAPPWAPHYPLSLCLSSYFESMFCVHCHQLGNNYILIAKQKNLKI